MTTIFRLPAHYRTVFTRDYVLMMMLVCLTCAATLPLITKYPSPGGDEPAFVDVAVNVLARGVIGTDAHAGLLPGAERHVYWQPPLYFVVLAGWMSLVGTGLFEVRALSFVAAIAIVLTVFSISRRYASPTTSAIAGSLLAVSFWLTDPASMARMDALCIALTLQAILAWQKAQCGLSLARWALAGVLAGLALLTHPLGVVAIAVIVLDLIVFNRLTTLRSGRALALLAAFAAVLGFWLAFILNDPSSFREQIVLQWERKRHLGSYWRQFWMAKTHVVTLGLTLSIAVWAAVTRQPGSAPRIVVLAFIISFATATFGREVGYFSYFYPFGCCVVALWLESTASRRFAIGFVALAFLNELTILGFNIYRYHHRDYQALSRVVLDTIPAGSTVFLGHSEVSPYFALMGRNPVRIAVPVKTNPSDAHARIALSSDFIVSSVPSTYLPDIGALINDARPAAIVDQGPGYRLRIFDRRTVVPDARPVR